ncbi:MAG: 6-carboxytetrahydropterin synthase, partial [Planctomycetota bacterium]|nr:6-carboxytetrahydropterin synthase [Planctomycetota bacterium]
MLELSRTIRFCIDFIPPTPPPPGLESTTLVRAEPKHNTFAGYPSMKGLGVYYELEVRVRGEADPVTGYLMNISEIDEAVRRITIPRIEYFVRKNPDRALATVLRSLLESLQPELNESIVVLRWRLTPYYSIQMKADDMMRVQLSQIFDFAAAHRLHCPELSEERNREVFGHCNNPNGHGHNYRLQVDVTTPVESGDAEAFTLTDLERIVDGQVVKRFDHTHLNLDLPDFDSLNPSVENIAK